MKTAFITDSSCGVHPDMLKEKGIVSLPLQIILPNEDKALLDFVDAPLETVYQYIEQGIMMSTSIPPLGLIEKTFKNLKKENYEAVFCIPINPGLSSCYNALRLAALEAGLEFHHVDVYMPSVFELYAITRAKEMYDEGISLDDIENRIREVSKNAMTFLIPNDLDHLKKGGRLTPLAATLAGLLKIKPILKIDGSCEGKIDVFDKIRTFNKAVDCVVNELQKRGVDESWNIAIAHSKGMEHAQLTKDKLQAAFPNHEIEIVELVSVISVHTGLDSVGIQAYQKI